MRKILVTGATGFIGRQCLQYLNDYEVHATYLSGWKSERWLTTDVVWYWADLLNDAKSIIETVRPTHLLHFAWFMEHGKYWTSEKNLIWLQASTNLLRAFADNGGQRVVIAGSCAEFGKSLYGICKHSLQLVTSAYCKARGISSAWGRIFFPYGAYERPQRLVPYVINNLLQNKEALCTSGTQVRDLVYVSDVAKAFVDILNSDVQGVVNIGSGTGTPIKEVVTTIGKLLQREELIKLCAVPDRPDETGIIIANNSCLQDIGWSPEFDLEIGIQKAIDYWTSK